MAELSCVRLHSICCVGKTGSCDRPASFTERYCGAGLPEGGTGAKPCSLPRRAGTGSPYRLALFGQSGLAVRSHGGSRCNGQGMGLGHGRVMYRSHYLARESSPGAAWLTSVFGYVYSCRERMSRAHHILNLAELERGPWSLIGDDARIAIGLSRAAIEGAELLRVARSARVPPRE